MELKKFQKNAVEYIYNKIFVEEKNRFLLADEVGLGKTVIAGGVIAKMLEQLEKNKEKPPANVLYLCSNIDLARENIDKLKKPIEEKIKDDPEGKIEVVPIDRLSMFFFEYMRAESSNRIHLCSLSPATAAGNTGGIFEERALAYFLCKAVCQEPDKVNKESFQGKSSQDIESESNNFFKEYCNDQDKTKLIETLKNKFNEYNNCKDENIKNAAQNIKTTAEKIYNSENVKELLAAMSQLGLALIKSYDNDNSLIIVDEIQNYSKAILGKTGNTEQDKVLQSIVEKNVLVLSATPFSYGSLGELEDNNENSFIEGDAHITINFHEIMKFVSPEWNEESWKIQAQNKLTSLEEGNKEKFKNAVQEQQKLLRKAGISRTERTAAGSGFIINSLHNVERVTIDDFNVISGKKLEDDENILGYICVIFDELNYFFEYTDKSNLYNICHNEDDDESDDNDFLIHKLVENQLPDDLWSYADYDEWEIRESLEYDIDTYDFTDDNKLILHSGNNQTAQDNREDKAKNEALKKLKKLFSYNNSGKDRSIKMNVRYIKSTPAMLDFKEKGDGIYESLKGFSENENKELFFTTKDEWINNNEPIFSENHLHNSRMEALQNQIFDEEHGEELLFIPPCHSDYPLMPPFKGKEGYSKRLFFTEYAMTTQSLSKLLSYEAQRRAGESLPEYEEMIDEIIKGSAQYENRLTYGSEYLLGCSIVPNDCNYDKKYQELCNIIKKEGDKFQLKHLSIKELYLLGSPESYVKRRKIKDGKYTIDKFVHNWVYKALFNKAVYKTLLKYYPYDNDEKLNSFMTENNIQKEKTCLRLLVSIWAYCAAGNLHAVLDEYFYMKTGKKPEELEKLNETETQELKKSLQKSTDFFYIFVFKNKKTADKDKEDKSINKVLSAFAVGHFSKDSHMIEKKEAFNSPFYPFNFISTSVGQEGFDFHYYCRKIVHWGITWDPVKLEQREGRINRYHSYYTRLNVCRDYDLPCWEAFEKAKETIGENNADGLMPDWVYNGKSDNLFKIERECYYYPLSKEELHFKDVVKSLGTYRALLGQSDSETFEQKFNAFIQTVPDKEKKDYFVDLSPDTDKNE